MKKIGFSLLFVFIFTLFSFAQGRKLIDLSQYTTCENALEISTIEEFGPTAPPATIGHADGGYFYKDLHIVWYKFQAFKTGLLIFNIIPMDMLDNYDFMLFKYTGEDFCEGINNKTIKPIRSNLRKNNLNTSGKTGITITSQFNTFGEALEVKEGEYYYLAVNNVYKNGKGHSIEFKYLEPMTVYFLPNDPNGFIKESEVVVKEVVDILQKNPAKKAHLEGHTNGFWPSTDVDQELSERRAEALKNIFINRGVAENRITTSGAGSSKLIYPKASNEIEEGLNRRVEIKITE